MQFFSQEDILEIFNAFHHVKIMLDDDACQLNMEGLSQVELIWVSLRRIVGGVGQHIEPVLTLLSGV